MATEVLPAALTEADSATITLADGIRANLFLTGAAAQAASMTGAVLVQFQNSGSGWTNVFWMDNGHRTARIDGPVTFRVRRPVRDERSLALGVDRA